MNYQPNGNISSKTGIGNYSYSGDRPHAVDTVDNVDGLIPDYPQTVKYNSWGKVSEISYVIDGDSYQYTITYGPDMQRWYTHFKKNGVVQHYTYYGNGYENCYHQENAYTYAIRTYYINTPDGLSGVHMYDTRTSAYTSYAVEKDHLGSITGLYDSNGTKRLNANYDVWGKRNVTAGSIEFNRGFTGHEHIIGFDLINMNGRVYDPLIGRFLSPDPFIQMPSNIQNYNRYSYCLNNPLKYTDPSGEKWGWWALAEVLSGGMVSLSAATTYSTTLITVQSLQSVVVPTDLTVQYFNTLFNNDYHSANQKMQNFFKIETGLFITDENRDFGDRAWQLISRHTRESLQTSAGNTYSHVRNIFENNIRVDYFGGATFVTKENSGKRDGISIGNYININIKDEIDGSFEERVIKDPLFMHEYGHAFDSQIYGMSYLHYVGISSLLSANKSEYDYTIGRTTHSGHWTEKRANRHAAKYFQLYYGVDWLNNPLWDDPSRTIEDKYPR